MNKVYQQMIYLAACGINRISPKKEYLQDADVQRLYQISASHQMDALIGNTLQKAEIALPKEWEESIAKAIRKEILFDAERAQIFAFMEQNGIWYLPLKGIILKDYYPSVGMRQMSDNDILYDADFCEEMQKFMEERGYESSFIGQGHHDVYKKEPVFYFELHRLLYGEMHQEGWMEYYRNVKDRLILNANTSHGYHFTEEDFYLHMVSHAYKHYTGSGTGLRTLLDFYAYLKNKEEKLDFAYIEQECEVLKCAEFERLNRRLCRKIFSEETLSVRESIWNRLEEEEVTLLEVYLTGGLYGTLERGLESRIRKFQKKSGSKSKVRYIMSRVFSVSSIYWHFPFVAKHKWLLPIACIGRIFKTLFDTQFRNRMRQELEMLGKM